MGLWCGWDYSGTWMEFGTQNPHGGVARVMRVRVDMFGMILWVSYVCMRFKIGNAAFVYK